MVNNRVPLFFLKMRLYLEIGIRAFRRATTYRSAYVAGMITNAFFGAMISYVYLAVYAGQDLVAGMSRSDAVTYVWITQSLISIGAAWIASDLDQTIKSGDVIADLMRPWDFYGYWLSRSIGERLFNLLVRGSLTFLVGVLYFRARLPDLEAGIGFLASIIIGMLISFAFGFMINMTAFWLLDTTGVSVIANIMLGFFSGFLLPIAFFPEPLAIIARLLPFQAISGLPAQIFLGQIRGMALIETLMLQLFWLVVMTLLAQLVLRNAVKKVVIQGG